MADGESLLSCLSLLMKKNNLQNIKKEYNAEYSRNRHRRFAHHHGAG